MRECDLPYWYAALSSFTFASVFIPITVEQATTFQSVFQRRHKKQQRLQAVLDSLSTQCTDRQEQIDAFHAKFHADEQGNTVVVIAFFVRVCILNAVLVLLRCG